MPSRMPFIPSRNNYRLIVPLSNVPYLFDVHWNDTDEDKGWYIDIREADETLILAGAKILLNTKLGRGSTHQFFKDRTFDVLDTLGTNKDAGYDDLGGRIQVLVTEGDE